MLPRTRQCAVGIGCAAIIVAVLGMEAKAGTATLDWTNPAPTATAGTATGNRVYRATDALVCSATTPLPGTPYATLGVVNAYTDSATPNVAGTVCYEVTAFNAYGESPRSNRVSKPTVNANPPIAPSNLVVR